MKQFLIILVLLSVATWVHAAKPDIFTYEYPDTVEIVNCGSFSVMDDFLEQGTVQTFYDKEGNFVREQIHVTVYDDMYRFDDPSGPHVYGTGHINARLFSDKEGYLHWSESGLGVSIFVPGEGHLLFDVGRLVWSESSGWDLTFSAGNRHDWEDGDFEALCDYFE